MLVKAPARRNIRLVTIALLNSALNEFILSLKKNEYGQLISEPFLKMSKLVVHCDITKYTKRVIEI